MRIELPAPVTVLRPPALSQELEGAMRVTAQSGDFRIQRLVLTDGPRAGVELLLVDTGTVRAAICPTRGMNLWKARINELDYGWESPVDGPIHPNFVALDEPGGIGWLDGFDELVARCGMRSFGAPDRDESGQVNYALHGRVSNLPARNVAIFVDQERSTLEVHGEICETRFLQYNLRLQAKYKFAIGVPTIEIHDTVRNASATATTMQMLYHINIGVPILESGSKLQVGSERVVARDAHAAAGLASWREYTAPTADYAEQVYFFASHPDDDGWARAMLTSNDASRGFAVHFRTETLPFFTQWKHTAATEDGYVAGFEPGTGFPNPRSFEEAHGRLVAIAPDESIDFHLKLEGVSRPDRVEQLAKQIAASQTNPIEKVQHDPNWCV